MAVTVGDVCLSHDFVSQKRERVHAEVNASGLLVKKYGKRGIESHLEHKFVDIIGASVVGSDGLEVWSCPFVNKTVLRKAGRRLFTLQLRVDGVDSPDRRAVIATAFLLAIARGARGLDISVRDTPPTRRFLVFVNPFSGTRQAPKLMQTIIQPMLMAGGVEAEVVTSTHRGFAEDYAKTMDVSQKECMLFVSGDGLITEAMNGVMSRPDWKSVLEVPFAPIPAGTGNAVSASLLHACKENYAVVEAVYMTLKGSVVPVDMMCISTAKRRTFSVLTLTWGFLADIDIESEKYRLLGSSRFAVSFIEKVASIKKYPCKLSFLRASAVGKEEAGTGLYQTETVSDVAVGLVHVERVPKPSSRRSLRRRSSQRSRSEADDGKQSASQSPSATTLQQSSSTEKSTGSFCLPTSGYLPEPGASVPSSWTTVADESLVGFNAVLPSHIGWDLFMLRDAKVNDGFIHLVYIGEKANRKSLFAMFDILSSDTGRMAETAAAVERFDLHYERVKAFRLEMDPADSHVAVDGEHVSGGSVQCEILPKLARVIAMLPENYGASAVQAVDEAVEQEFGDEVKMADNNGTAPSDASPASAAAAAAESPETNAEGGGAKPIESDL